MKRRFPIRRPISKIGFIALLLGLGMTCAMGCGGESGHDSSALAASADSARLIPPQDFLRDAEAICNAGNSERSEDGLAFFERRKDETGEPLGLVGNFEVVHKVIVPSLRREIGQLESIGLPRGEAYEAESLWQTLHIVLHEVEVEGLYAWRSAKLLTAFHHRAKQFGLQSCVVN